MNLKRMFVGLSAVAVLTVLIAWAGEWRAGRGMREEIARLQQDMAVGEQLRAEAARLHAAEVTATESKALREEHAVVLRLRGEIDQLRRLADERARVLPKEAGAEEATPTRERTMVEDFVPFAAWKNVGHATPADALQTALWAAAGGDLKVLAGAIVLDIEGREKVQQLLGRLPPEVRTQFPTAENFVALLTSKDVPLTQAHLQERDTKMPEGSAMWVAEFRNEAGTTRRAPIVLKQMSPGEWRLVVPAAAIDKYAAMLSGPAAGGGN